MECFEGHWSGCLQHLGRNPVHPRGLGVGGGGGARGGGGVEADDHRFLWNLVEHSEVHSGGFVEQGTEVFSPPCVDAALLLKLSRVEPSADRSGVVRGLVGP